MDGTQIDCVVEFINSGQMYTNRLKLKSNSIFKSENKIIVPSTWVLYFIRISTKFCYVFDIYRIERTQIDVWRPIEREKFLALCLTFHIAQSFDWSLHSHVKHKNVIISELDIGLDWIRYYIKKIE